MPSRSLELLFFNDTSAERMYSRLKWQFDGRLYRYKLSKWVIDGKGRGGLKTDRKYLENRLAESTGKEIDSTWRWIVDGIGGLDFKSLLNFQKI